jgi:AI-2 transport protein TqsA
VIFFGAIGAVAAVVAQEVLDLSRDEEFQRKIQELLGQVGDGVATMLGVEIQELKQTSVAGNNTATSSLEVVSISELGEKYGSYAQIGNDMVTTFLLLVYMLSTREPLDYRLELKMQRKELVHTLSLAQEIYVTVKFYIAIKTMISLLTGFLVMTTFLVLGVRLAVVFGVLTYLLNYIPNVGSVIALLLPIPLIVIDDELTLLAKILAISITAMIQLLVGNAVEPLVFGSSLNLSAISILASLVLFAAMWGICGAILSVPLLAILRIILQRTDHPLAKRLLAVIRESHKDALLAVTEMNKRHKLWKPQKVSGDEKHSTRVRSRYCLLYCSCSTFKY